MEVTKAASFFGGAVECGTPALLLSRDKGMWALEERDLGPQAQPQEAREGSHLLPLKDAESPSVTSHWLIALPMVPL